MGHAPITILIAHNAVKYAAELLFCWHGVVVFMPWMVLSYCCRGGLLWTTLGKRESRTFGSATPADFRYARAVDAAAVSR